MVGNNQKKISLTQIKLKENRKTDKQTDFYLLEQAKKQTEKNVQTV